MRGMTYLDVPALCPICFPCSNKASDIFGVYREITLTTTANVNRLSDPAIREHGILAWQPAPAARARVMNATVRAESGANGIIRCSAEKRTVDGNAAAALPKRTTGEQMAEEGKKPATSDAS